MLCAWATLRLMPCTVKDHHALGHTVRVSCAACGHVRILDLPTMIAEGLGDRELARLRFRCTRMVAIPGSPEMGICGGRRVEFLITPKSAPTL